MIEKEYEYVYGINPVFEVIRARRREIAKIYVNKAGQNNPRIKKLISFIQRLGLNMALTDKNQLFNLCKTTEHQGVVLQGSSYPYAAIEDILNQSRVLLLDNIEDPHNLGSILRSAEIFGFKGVILPNKGVPDIYPSVVKSSAGASEHLFINKSMSSNKYIQIFHDQGYLVIALDMKGEHNLAEVKLPENHRILMVIGGENKSIGQFILNNADYRIFIPQTGLVNSLNASVAAGITMFAFSQKTH